MNDLWNYIQQNPFYKDHTALLVTVDHGRERVTNGPPTVPK